MERILECSEELDIEYKERLCGYQNLITGLFFVDREELKSLKSTLESSGGLMKNAEYAEFIRERYHKMERFMKEYYTINLET